MRKTVICLNLYGDIHPYFGYEQLVRASRAKDEMIYVH